jgi:hypothetical protein
MRPRNFVNKAMIKLHKPKKFVSKKHKAPKHKKLDV